jgi:hypothetical protein
MEKGKIIQLKTEQKGLTIEKLKKYKGFENVTDAEAEDIILNLRRFAMLLCRYYKLCKDQQKLKAAA